VFDCLGAFADEAMNIAIVILDVGVAKESYPREAPGIDVEAPIGIGSNDG
jgi:hypothetical protein